VAARVAAAEKAPHGLKADSDPPCSLSSALRIGLVGDALKPFEVQLRQGRSPATDAREESATGVNWTLIAFGLRAFADFLAVSFQQQVGASACIEVLGDFYRDCLLRFVVGHTIVLSLLTALDPDKHVRAIGGNGGNGSYAAE
jgi:hypothetical protein